MEERARAARQGLVHCVKRLEETWMVKDTTLWQYAEDAWCAYLLCEDNADIPRVVTIATGPATCLRCLIKE